MRAPARQPKYPRQSDQCICARRRQRCQGAVHLRGCVLQSIRTQRESKAAGDRHCKNGLHLRWKNLGLVWYSTDASFWHPFAADAARGGINYYEPASRVTSAMLVSLGSVLITLVRGAYVLLLGFLSGFQNFRHKFLPGRRH